VETFPVDRSGKKKTKSLLAGKKELWKKKEKEKGVDKLIQTAIFPKAGGEEISKKKRVLLSIAMREKEESEWKKGKTIVTFPKKSPPSSFRGRRELEWDSF